MSPLGSPPRHCCSPIESLSKEIGEYCASTVTNLDHLNTPYSISPMLTLPYSVKPCSTSSIPPFNEYDKVSHFPHQLSSVFNHTAMTTALPFPYSGLQTSNFISQTSNTTNRSGSIRESNSPFHAQYVVIFDRAEPDRFL